MKDGEQMDRRGGGKWPTRRVYIMQCTKNEEGWFWSPHSSTQTNIQIFSCRMELKPDVQ